MNARLLIVLMLLCAGLSVSCGKKAPPVWTDPAPPKPAQGLTIATKDDRVVLKWRHEDMHNVAEFLVTKIVDGQGKEAGRTRALEFTDTPRSAKVSYAVTALGLKSGMQSAPSNEVTYDPANVPAKPTALSVHVDDEGASLLWQHPDMEARFVVYRISDSATFEEARPGHRIDLTSTVGAGFIVGAYVIKDNVRYSSALSDAVTLEAKLLVPPAPVGLDATATEQGVVLSWDESSLKWIRGYRIYRDRALVGEARVQTYLDAAAMHGAYSISALGPGGEGPRSAEVVVGK